MQARDDFQARAISAETKLGRLTEIPEEELDNVPLSLASLCDTIDSKHLDGCVSTLVIYHCQRAERAAARVKELEADLPRVANIEEEIAWLRGVITKMRAEAKTLGFDLAKSHHGLCNSMGHGAVGGPGNCCSCRVTHKSEWRDLKAEIRYLRHYGNRDCTAQADEARGAGELGD